MLLVKRDQISLLDFIIRRHQFQLERRIEIKQLKNRMKEKACQQMSFDDWFWKVSSPNGLSVLPTRRKKEKQYCLCACYLLFDPVIKGKIVEDEAIYNP